MAETVLHFLLLTPDDSLAAELTIALRAAGHAATRLDTLPDLAGMLPRADALLADLSARPGDAADDSVRLGRIVATMPVLLLGEPLLDVPGAHHTDRPADAAGVAARLVALGSEACAASGGRWLGGELAIDLVHEQAILDGQRVELTPIEWRIVAALATQATRAVPRADLARTIAGDSGEATDNAVAVHLYNLRRKLGRHAIETIRGRGFRLRP